MNYLSKFIFNFFFSFFLFFNLFLVKSFALTQSECESFTYSAGQYENGYDGGECLNTQVTYTDNCSFYNDGTCRADPIPPNCVVSSNCAGPVEEACGISGGVCGGTCSSGTCGLNGYGVCACTGGGQCTRGGSQCVFPDVPRDSHAFEPFCTNEECDCPYPNDWGAECTFGTGTAGNTCTAKRCCNPSIPGDCPDNKGHCADGNGNLAPPADAVHNHCFESALGWTAEDSTSYSWWCLAQGSVGGGNPGDVLCRETKALCSIRGYKVIMPGNKVIEPASSQRISVVGGPSSTSQPYSFDWIQASGVHTVTSSVPNGYSVRSILDYNDTDNRGSVAGNSRNVNTALCANGFATLWWYYTPTSCTLNLPATATVLNGGTTTLTATVSITGTATVDRVIFGSGNVARVTVATPLDDTAPFRTQIAGVSNGTAVITATATLSSGSVCSDTTTVTVSTPNNAPTFTSLVVKNNVGTAVPMEVGNRNQICQSNFNNSRTVTATVTAADAQGAGTISNIQLRLGSAVFTRTSLLNGVANFTYTFGAAENLNTSFEYNITDSGGLSTGWIAAPRTFKSWNCSVPISGSIFDDSAQAGCVGGFTNLADSSMGFSSLTYKNMSAGADVVGSVAPPASFGTNNLIWGKSYLPLINGGSVGSENGTLLGTGRTTRLNGVCPVSAQFTVDTNAYAAIPTLDLDMSFVQNQENWYQGRGLDIKAKTKIASGVPDVANSALSVDNPALGTVNNGIVASPTFENTSGWNSSAQYGSPNNWYYNKSLLDPTKFNYQKLYSEYFVKLGAGVTNVTTVGTGSTGVMFVNGDLTINSDVVVLPNQYLMVVASGTINFGTGAKRIDGIYVANGGINATGTVVGLANQLVINGVLYAAVNSDIRLSRGFSDLSLNNVNPAVIVNYRPDLLFALPGRLYKVFTGWREY